MFLSKEAALLADNDCPKSQSASRTGGFTYLHSVNQCRRVSAALGVTGIRESGAGTGYREVSFREAGKHFFILLHGKAGVAHQATTA